MTARMPWWIPAASALAAACVRLVALTWRMTPAEGFNERERALRREPVIYALWHARMLPLAHTHRGTGIVVLVGQHHDGELIARIVGHFGFGTARGSSTRGGEAGLRELLEHARAGRSLGIIPDGPRGPAERAKPGVAYLASRTGLPVVPIATAPRSAWIARSWDGFRVPYPFTRVGLAIGEPVSVPPNLDAVALEPWTRVIEAGLTATTAAADRVVGLERAAGAAAEGA